MAISFLARVGKSSLTSLSITATVADLLSELKRSDESYVSVWSSSNYSDSCGDCKCVGKICTVDVICFLCREENIFRPYDALQFCISDILTKVPGIVRHLEPSSRYMRRCKPDTGFPLFESESLKWHGFVEFDDVNGKVLTYSAQDSIYKVFDLKNYTVLYSISDKNVQEIKIRIWLLQLMRKILLSLLMPQGI